MGGSFISLIYSYRDVSFFFLSRGAFAEIYSYIIDQMTPMLTNRFVLLVFLDVVRSEAASCSVLFVTQLAPEPLIRCMYSLVSSELS